MTELTIRSSKPVPAKPAPLLRQITRGPWRIALAVMLLFFVGGGYFAASAQLATSVIGVGRVAVEGQKRDVQSIETGRIVEVLVHDGDVVDAGDTLIRLETSVIDLRISNTRSQLRQVAARQARLVAEQQGAEQIIWTHPSLSDPADPAVLDILQSETKLFRDRRTRFAAEQVVLEQRIEQLEAQTDGEQIRLESLMDRRDLVANELADLQVLNDSGLVTRNRLSSLQREEAALRGDIGGARASIASARAAIGETRLRISEMQSRLIEEVSTQIPETEGQRIELEAELATLQQQRDRHSLKASIPGVVFNLKHSGPGPVVAPGEVVLQIVPFQSDIIVETSIRPSDIDTVAVGMEARVVFSAVPIDAERQTEAHVTFISPDVVVDEQDRQEFYQARVEIPQDQLKEDLPEFEPLVGMPTEVYFVTGQTTLIEYLAEPILDVLRRGLRE